MLDWVQQIDWAVLHGMRDVLSCGVMDFLMPRITALGDNGVIWIVAAAAMTISKKYRKYGIAMFAALAVGVLVGNVCLKNLIARSRPCWLEQVPLLSVRSYAGFGDRCVYADGGEPQIRCCSHSFGGADRLFTAVSVCALSD